MNIDFISSAKPSPNKLSTNGDGDLVANKEGSKSEGEGFFSKLSALFKGDDAKALSASQESKLTEDVKLGDKKAQSGKGSEQAKTPATELDVAEGKEIEKLAQLDGEKVSAVDDEASKQSVAKEHTSKVEVISQTAIDSDKTREVKAIDKESSTPFDSEKIMESGDQILHKLKQANRVLSQPTQRQSESSAESDGKTLPVGELELQTDAKGIKLKTDEAQVVSTVNGVNSDRIFKENSDSDTLKADLKMEHWVANTGMQGEAKLEAKSDVKTDSANEVKKELKSEATSDLRSHTEPQNSGDKLAGALHNEKLIMNQNDSEMSQQEGALDLDASQSADADIDMTEDQQMALAVAAFFEAQKQKLDTSELASLQEGGRVESLSSPALVQELGQVIDDGEEAESIHQNESLATQASVNTTNDNDNDIQATAALVGAENKLIQGKVQQPSIADGSTIIDTRQVIHNSEDLGALNDKASRISNLGMEAVISGSEDNDLESTENSEGKREPHVVFNAQALAQSQAKSLNQNPIAAAINERTPAQLSAAPVAPMMADTATNAVLTPNAVPTAAVLGGASMLMNTDNKAKWSAEHLQASGVLAQEQDRSQTGSESHFSQQLSSLSGLNSQTSSPLNRSEAMPPQVPVMINKEVAADQLSERVQMMLSKNLKNIDIRLDPPELGRMHIRMNVSGDTTSVHFTVANQHVRDALEGSMPRLREMLAQQGVQLGDTGVQQQSANQQQGYASGGRAQSQSDSNIGGDLARSEDNFAADVKLDLNVATKRDGISYYA